MPQETEETLYVTPAVWGLLSALGSEMVMVQLKEPTLEGASMETVMLLLLPAAMLPEAELIWHQVWLVVPVQFNVAVPVLLMFKGWPDGVGPPETPVKVREGPRTMWGLGRRLVNGERQAPGITVMVGSEGVV